ncbi:peptidase C39 [Acinetobacter cumulans]|uniref:Peptidase C39 n=1 Tax=Acinetobacter cumulans TaxID=2136182 RepID=A0A3A8G7U2_9GAMM|nr:MULTISPECIES: cysteine peptidase family C39 domain-containing protein [Acinetobacter]NWK74329.1 peptidase C39 [Acinetobacter sp. SwsAc6]QCO20137.1 peptidase C39 [Acinetobacter cumulans]RFS35966.1 peptidase C39 [Acinetobacter sp. SWAC5]RKG42556.1 peptidase C39 [Acinetobacter cumulans]RKG49811.1 peptidase C39 [Acinetobacter cumulans]
MGLKIPEALLKLKSNSGVYAVWMVLQHYGIQADIQRLVKITGYDGEGAFSIGLALALQKLGCKTSFHTAPDPDKQPKEIEYYQEAKQLNIPIQAALSYEQIKEKIDQGYFVIVYYDTVEGVGHHSLVYSMNSREICFFDNFTTLSARTFEKRRKAEGICRQAIVIDGSKLADIKLS